MQDSRFVRQMLDRLESELCIDLDRIHLTGISNGALMVYQLALDLAGRVASVAPVAGSRFLGYNRQPAAPVALLDIHGYADIYVPANASARTVTKTTNVTRPLKHRTIVTTTTITTEVLAGPAGSIVSEDDFYYTPLANLTAAFAAANGCSGGNLPHATRWDGIRDFSCNRPHGECGASAVVTCAGDWGHTWPLHEVCQRGQVGCHRGALLRRHRKAWGLPSALGGTLHLRSHREAAALSQGRAQVADFAAMDPTGVPIGIRRARPSVLRASPSPAQLGRWRCRRGGVTSVWRA